MIVCVTGDFPTYDREGHPTGKKEFVVSHGIDEAGRTVILPNEPPTRLGAKFSTTLGEWVLLDSGETLEDFGL